MITPGALSTPALSVRYDLDEVSLEAEAVWWRLRMYCADVVADPIPSGKPAVHKARVVAALGRRITNAQAQKLIGELLARGLVIDDGDHWRLTSDGWAW